MEENCKSCIFNGGDVCLGYGTLPSDEETDDTTYGKPINYVMVKLGSECCDAYDSSQE